MRLKTKAEIARPAAEVFARIADVPLAESLARRRGLSVTRRDGLPDGQPGNRWSVEGHYRGRRRQADVTLTDVTPGETLVFDATGGGMQMTLRLEVIPLAARRCRLVAETDIRARSLAARILLHSLRFGRAALQKRADAAMARVAASLSHPGV